jgi:chromosome segregation ATPase
MSDRDELDATWVAHAQRTEITRLRSEVERLTQERDGYKEDAERVREQRDRMVAKAQAERDALQQQVDALQRVEAALRVRLVEQTLLQQREIERLSLERDALQQQIDALQAKVHLTAGYDALASENERLREDVASRTSERVRVLLAKNYALESAFASQQERYNMQQRDNTRLVGALAELGAERDQIIERCAEVCEKEARKAIGLTSGELRWATARQCAAVIRALKGDEDE